MKRKERMDPDERVEYVRVICTKKFGNAALQFAIENSDKLMSMLVQRVGDDDCWVVIPWCLMDNDQEQEILQLLDDD